MTKINETVKKFLLSTGQGRVFDIRLYKNTLLVPPTYSLISQDSKGGYIISHA